MACWLMLSGLGFGYGLIRFLPSAGERASTLINSCFTVAGGGVSLRCWPQPVVTRPPLYSRPRALRLLCTPHHSIHPLHAYRPSLYRQTPCQVCSLQECCRWHGQNSGLLVIALLTCFGPQHQIYWRCAASDEDTVASGLIRGKICFLEKIWNLT